MPTATGEPGIRPLTALRAFGVMLGGPVLLASAAAAGLASTLRALARRRRPPPAGMLASAGSMLYALAVRPCMRNWGATAEEHARRLPGDELGAQDGAMTTRAVTIDAPAEEVWPWVAQMGRGQGGFYSYEWLENLAGCRMRNADRIHPEWQDRRVGENVLLHPANGLELELFEPPRVFALKGWGSWVVEPLGPGSSRLIARGRGQKGPAAVAYALLLELPHFIMERKMLLGIKTRAERSASS